MHAHAREQYISGPITNLVNTTRFMKIHLHANAKLKRKEKRSKNLKFCAFSGRFQLTAVKWLNLRGLNFETRLTGTCFRCQIACAQLGDLPFFYASARTIGDKVI